MKIIMTLQGRGVNPNIFGGYISFYFIDSYLIFVIDLPQGSITFQVQLNNNCNRLKHNFVFEEVVPEFLVQDFKPLEPTVDIFMSRSYQFFDRKWELVRYCEGRDTVRGSPL